MFLLKKKKNTYTATDINTNGGVQYGSNIHQVTLQMNQSVWDMMKVLKKENLFGFHIESKISKSKIVIILNHKDKESLEQAKKVLKDSFYDDNILFLTKVIEKKKSNFVRNSYVFIALSSALGVSAYAGFEWYQKNTNPLIVTGEKNYDKELHNEVVIEKVEIDAKKLLALKEVFVEESQFDGIKKAMAITTDIISMSVSEEEKAKYSTEALVKNFKGKSGIEFVLKESNSTEVEELHKISKDFIATNHKELNKIVSNQSSREELVSLLKESKEFDSFLEDKNNSSLNINVKELDGYAKAFMEENHKELAEKCYSKALKDYNLTNNDKAYLLIQKAFIALDRNESEKAKENYLLSLDIYKKLSKKNSVDISNKEAFVLEQLSWYKEGKEKIKLLKEIEDIYLNDIQKLRKLSKKNSKKYEKKLAKELHHIGNFYFNYLNNRDKAISFNKEATDIYKRVKRKDKNSLDRDYLTATYDLVNKYNSIGAFTKSEKNLLEILSLLKPLENEQSLSDKAELFKELGTLYSKMKTFKKAEKYYLLSLNRYSDLIEKNYYKYKPMELKVKLDKTVYLVKMKKFAEAEKNYKSILMDYDQLSHNKSTAYNIEMVKVWNSFAKMLFLKGDKNEIQKVQRYINNSLKLSTKVIKEESLEVKEVQSQSYFYLALLFELNNNFDKVDSYYQKALKAKESFLISVSYFKFLVKNEKPVKAQQIYKNLFTRDNLSKEQQAELLMEYGLFYTQINTNKASVYLKKSLKIYEGLSKKYNKEYKEIGKILDLLKSKGAN